MENFIRNKVIEMEHKESDAHSTPEEEIKAPK